MQTSTPVLILPCGLGHGSTCLVRSLGRIGVPVYCVESDPGAFASRSRYCKGRFAWDDQLPVPESVEFLIDVSRKIGQRPILIPTTDDTVTLVADHAATLKEWFIFPDLSSHLVRSLCSKKEMYCLAKRSGVPTPEAVFPGSRAEVLEFIESATFPVMFKGVDGNRLAEHTGKKM